MLFYNQFLLLSFLSSISAFAPQAWPKVKTGELTPLLATLDGEEFERRSFFTKSAVMALTVSTLFGNPSPSTATSTSIDYKAVAADIADLVKADPDKGPTLVRLAWHSSGTYDKMSKDGGSQQGTIRFKEELAHGGNAGLGKTAVAWLERIKEKYGDGLSYADLYTLGGGMCADCVYHNLWPNQNSYLI